VVEFLGQLVSIVPSGLVKQLISALWSACNKAGPRSGAAKYERQALMLQRLSEGLKGRTGPSVALAGAWRFLEEDLAPLLQSQAFVTDLGHALEGPSDEAGALSLLDDLATALGHFPIGDVDPRFLSVAVGLPTEPAAIYLACALVRRGVRPLSSLASSRTRLVGQGTRPALAGAPGLTAFWARAWEGADPGMQKEVVISLLDYLIVKPGEVRPLALLTLLLTGWYPARMLYVAEDVGGDWRAARGFLVRFAEERLTASDMLRIQTLEHSVGMLLRRVSLEGESDVLSRVMRLWGSLPAGAEHGLLRWVLRRMVVGAKASRAVAREALATSKVLIAQQCVQAACAFDVTS
jgi:hypothetical protein